LFAVKDEASEYFGVAFCELRLLSSNSKIWELTRSNLLDVEIYEERNEIGTDSAFRCSSLARTARFGSALTLYASASHRRSVLTTLDSTLYFNLLRYDSTPIRSVSSTVHEIETVYAARLEEVGRCCKGVPGDIEA